MSTYKTAIQILQEKTNSRGINYSLDFFQQCADRLGNPEKKLPKTIHIAGTNGKGSTLSFIEQGLRQQGFSVGTYTSPHLESYTERISLNGSPISEEDFANLFEVCLTKIGVEVEQDYITQYELLTLMAFEFFKKKQPDFVLFETGLGGRLDATNVIHPDVSVITKMGLDHQSILGETIEKITLEKAGIIKPKTPVFVLKQDPKVLTLIQKKAKENQASCVEVSADESEKTYQKENLSLAKAVLGHLCPEVEVEKMSFSPPWGRFTVIKRSDQTIVIDGAHNQQGIEALLTSLENLFPDSNPGFLLGFSRPDQIKMILPQIKAKSREIWYCEFDSNDAVPYQQLPQEGVQEWRKERFPYCPKTPLLVITGSIYFVGMLKQYERFQGLSEEAKEKKCVDVLYKS